MANLLLVDDDDAVREVLAFNLTEAGHSVTCASDGAEGLARYSEDIDLVLTDLRMPKMDGMALLTALRERDPAAVVIVLTAFGGSERALEAMRHGAFHYVEKPVNRNALHAVVEAAAQHSQLGRENRRLRADQHAIVAASPKMNRVLRLVDKIADTGATVLIRGESGTGKELVARALHAGSSRRRREFVTVNCAAIPGELLESALFGHERGAFTGASRAATGSFARRIRGRSFWMRSRRCRWLCRPSCCGFFRRVRSRSWAGLGRNRSTFGSSPRPIATSLR